MSDLTPRTRALLDLGREGDDPTDADMVRNQRSLAARLGAAAVVAAVGTASTTTATAGIVGSGVKMALVIATLAVGGAVATTVIGSRRPAPGPAPTAAVVTSIPAMEPGAASAPSATVAPALAEDPASSAQEEERAPSAVVPAPRASAARGLKDELDLLRAAQEELHAGRGAQALERLSEHARRFPRGALWEEREVSRVLALCRLGNVAAARAQADRFIQKAPQSPFVDRVRDACR